jgi:hypothetical protein
MNEESVFQAKLALDLPGTIEPQTAPKEIQWAPPGYHEINASRGGKPVKLKVNVTEATAAIIAQAHRTYLAEAGSGRGDLPYFDFNHDDQEASGHPTEFYWGGNDPQRGGVRAKLTWTGSGRSAVIGRTYRRFSPSFYADDNGNITGAPVNMGGLVNRAAFQRIAPIVAKEKEMIVLASPQPSFFEKSKVVARARNIDIAQAYELTARLDPLAYAEYRASLGLGDSRELVEARKKQAAKPPVFFDQFLLEAVEISEQEDLVLAEACERLAQRKPGLYERYRCRILGRDPEDAAVHSKRPAVFGQGGSAFEQRVKIVASERGLKEMDAIQTVAREQPDLYESYRTNL